MDIQVKTKVIKRNGEEVNFDLTKIENAINKANAEVDNIYKMNEYQIRAIADDIAQQVGEMRHAVHVEDIQDNSMLLAARILTALPSGYNR